MNRALALDVLGIGVLGPGLPDWQHAAARLRGAEDWCRTPTVVPTPASLPATERRRAGTLVRASIVVAEEACRVAAVDPATLATVFASSTGDAANCHTLCEALAARERMVSPTRFTNSVHNAPAGYWHIATRSVRPSTSLAAHDASFTAALMEAAVSCCAEAQPVLLVACDIPFPQPLHALRPIDDVFALAMLIAPASGRDGFSIRPAAEARATPMAHAGRETLRQGVPAARALPLLQALARSEPASLVLDGVPGLSVTVDVR